MSTRTHFDLLIVGGGPVGGALALALADSGLHIGLLEARQQPLADARALALAYASYQQLEKLKVWPASAATPIQKVHVSQQASLGRVLLSASDLNLPVLGYVLPYFDLATAVHQRLGNESSIQYLCGYTATGLEQLGEYAVLQANSDAGEHMLTAKLVVLAEGGQLLGQAGLQQQSRDYRQTAIVTELQTSQAHEGMAWERFASDGPLALLPKGDKLALVWTRPAQDPLDALHLDEATFLAELQSRIGDRAGRLLSCGPRSSFPLRLRWASQHSARRVAVVGNAAQTLHPVAGQGFNLGLRDALCLARLLNSCDRQQLGGPAMLARYAQLRKRDSLTTVGITDGLIRLFGINSAPLKHARSLAMLGLDNLPMARQSFAAQMVFGTL